VCCVMMMVGGRRGELVCGVSLVCPSTKAPAASPPRRGATALSLRDSVITQKACRSGGDGQVQGLLENL